MYIIGYADFIHSRYVLHCSSRINSVFGPFDRGIRFFTHIKFGFEPVWRNPGPENVFQVIEHDIGCTADLYGFGLLMTFTYQFLEYPFSERVWVSDRKPIKELSAKESLVLFSAINDRILCFQIRANSAIGLWASLSMWRFGISISISVVLPLSSRMMRLQLFTRASRWSLRAQ